MSVRCWQMTDCSWCPDWHMSAQETCCPQRRTHTHTHRHMYVHPNVHKLRPTVKPWTWRPKSMCLTLLRGLLSVIRWYSLLRVSESQTRSGCFLAGFSLTFCWSWFRLKKHFQLYRLWPFAGLAFVHLAIGQRVTLLNISKTDFNQICDWAFKMSVYHFLWPLIMSA